MSKKIKEDEVKHKLTIYGLQCVYADITAEIQEAEELFPKWPRDLIHGDQIINEEKGEATKAVMDHLNKGERLEEYRDELIQTAAMVIRQLVYLETIL